MESKEMKKTILLMSLFLLTSIMTFAIPALPGLWRNITLSDGTTVYAQLKGDDNISFYEDKDGNIYTLNEAGTYTLTSKDTFSNTMKKASARRRAANPLRVADVGKKYLGSKHCLIILAEFPDKKFAEGHDNAFYNRVMNEKGFTTSDGFVGSVKDYFLAQSDGKFDLTFDVKGPYMMSNNYSYYGKDRDANTHDVNAIYMARECTAQANEKKDVTDWKQYDWDGDGDVDLIYIIYAGYGQATGGDDNTIWPHANRGAYISSYGGVQERQFACSNEIDHIRDNSTGDFVAGIGTICHEFSHCLGFPDMYDVDYSGGYGMGSWDLMCSGSYNGSSFIPAGYSAYEKWVAGWISPLELGSADMAVSNLKPTQDGGQTYVIYNDAHKDEFFMIENRQKKGWDAGLAGSGLLINHVDYDATVWSQNGVNNSPAHQRCTVVPADGILNDYTEAGDLYPYGSRNSWTYTSNPKPSVFNRTSDGTYVLRNGLTKITRNGDGTISFQYLADTKPAEPTTKVETVMHESFDKCNGRGGSGAWGTQATGVFKADVTGWTTGLDGNMYGGNKCAQFGEKGYGPAFNSPKFTLNGDKATITIKVSPFANDKGTTLHVTMGNEVDKTFTLTKSKWNTFSFDTTANGTFQLTFETADDSRLWFDDLLIEQTITTTGINNVTINSTAARTADKRIFTLNGVYVGTDVQALPKGIYIMGGKKFVK